MALCTFAMLARSSRFSCKLFSVCLCGCVCAFVYKRERERERERQRQRQRERERKTGGEAWVKGEHHLHVCLRVCVYASERECVYLCVRLCV